MKKLTLLFFCGCGVFLCTMGCSKSDSVPTEPVIPPPIDETDTTPATKYDITKLDHTILFGTSPVVNRMQRQDYTELSGVAASQVNTGMLYVHNDNANTSIIITNERGDDWGSIVLDNVQTVNVEDISVGPGPDPDKSYIYLADIGDNNANRPSISVYRFPEPVINNPSPQTETHIASADRIQLKYPESPFNAETVLIDPLTKDLFIATKEALKSVLYTAAYPQSASKVTLLKPVLKMPFDLLTSGDVSPDGTEIVLRNKGQIWYWKRKAGQSMAQVIFIQPQIAPYAGNEHQGEGIGFAADGSGYFTDTEIKDHAGAESAISFYKRNGE